MVPQANTIEPADHPITLDMIDGDALHVMRTLNRVGFSSYLVGGGVRDLYLGKTPKDFDIGTDARPGQIRRLFPNSRTIGRRFRLVQVFFKKNKVIEVSTLRSLSEHDLDGPEVILAPNNTYGSLGEDAQRRDLTINALFYEIERQTVIDHVGGVSDLDQGIIRIIGTPEKRIRRDPVRMLRAIRHSARSGFSIEPLSWQALCDNHHMLSLCPPSRLRDEVLKDFYGGFSADWFSLAADSGLFAELFSQYADLLHSPLPDGSTCRDRLKAVFTTIDRLNRAAVAAGSHRQPAHVILSLILVPWADLHFDLHNVNLKGPQLNRLAKDIRETVNETIGPQISLQRLLRQEITTLLAHLPLLRRHRREDSWPKWLKRKSYFPACRLLHFAYREAAGGPPVPESLFLSQPRDRRDSPPSRRKTRGGRRGRPAFSGKRDGGVFGFKQ